MSFRFTGDRTNLILFVIFMATLLIYPALQRKVKLGLWHLWNGNTVRFQGYEIPVPTNWVADRPTGGDVILVEVGKDHTRDLVGTTIGILKGPASRDMNPASSRQEQFLESEGAQIFERRTVEFDTEKADCIVSNELISSSLKKGLPIPSDAVISITCESTAGFSIFFNGDKENGADFFSIVSQIRKVQ